MYSRSERGLRRWLRGRDAPRGEIALLCVPALALALVAWHGTASPRTAPLRVCADPNNLPFSNDARAGFENRIIELIAADLGRDVEYAWWPQRRGFVRNTLNAGKCDVVAGVLAGYELLRTTDPYYRSTYVFVTRADAALNVGSLDDASLRDARIGVHIIGDDYANSPAAQSLGKRGLGANLVGYSIYGDYSMPNPPAALVRAVANGEVDVAVIWGPLAGYFASTSPVPLRLTPVKPQVDLPFTPFVFDIAMGVRRADSATYELIQRELDRRHDDIQGILADYGVPLVRRPGRTGRVALGSEEGR